ncbi:unnamed protein product, partial [Mycena citricolor]
LRLAYTCEQARHLLPTENMTVLGHSKPWF